MPRFITSVLIGAIAGAIDIAPMLAQKLGLHACASAFVHWVVLGVLIAYIQMPMPPWVKGITVAVLSCLPVVILVSENDPKATIPILLMSVVVGAAVGSATFRYAKR
jgi:hypothetical protein